MKMIDYHIHSSYSIDSTSTIRANVEQAIDRGLDEIAITDHFEPTGLDNLYKLYNPEKQRKEIEELRSIYKNQITILQGVEIGQPHLFPEITKDVLSRVDFDFVIGSAHKDSKGIDLKDKDYRNGNASKIIKLYLEHLKALATDDQFDCIGHLDLVKRYAAKQKVQISLAPFIDDFADVLKVIISNGKGIEVNTSGIRQESKSFMPDLDLVCIYKDLGGEIITVGSDAHESKYVGESVHLAYEMIKSAGFSYITTYRKRKPIFQPLQKNTKYYQLG